MTLPEWTPFSVPEFTRAMADEFLTELSVPPQPAFDNTTYERVRSYYVRTEMFDRTVPHHRHPRENYAMPAPGEGMRLSQRYASKLLAFLRPEPYAAWEAARQHYWISGDQKRDLDALPWPHKAEPWS